MKILITGYTTRMFGSTRIRGDYLTFSFLLEDILKEMGHEVHRRQVTIGEELAYVYNYAFCGVAPLNSMTSGKVPETHYVMDQMKGHHAVYADDWSFCNFGDSVRYALKNWERYLKYKNFSYTPEQLEKTKDHIESMIKMYVAGNNAPVLAPMFPWGDHQFLMRNNYNANLITVDPSAWIKYPSLTIPTKKGKITQWVMAALSNHSAWVKKQGFTFPVKYVGNKRMGDGLVLCETDTVKLFANSFGVLSTGYPSAGSGWWRTRYLNAAWAESLIYSDPKDADVMGDAFQGTPELFETSLHLPRYDEIVNEQRIWLEEHISKKEEVIAVLDKLIKS